MVQTGTSNLQDHSATSQPCRKWGVCIFLISSYAATAKWPKWRPDATWWLPLSRVWAVFLSLENTSGKKKIKKNREAYALREVGPVWSPWHGKNTFWLSLNKWYVTMINTLSCRCWQENISLQNTAEQTRGLVTGRSLLLTSPSHVLFVLAWCVSLPARKAQGRFTQERN